MGPEPACFRALFGFPFDGLREFQNGWIQLIQQVQEIVPATTRSRP